ncbi:hypothetical protein HYPSUDRAFT_219078 [Hypholoma sublateritium FD-334 SS-4]|uniref:Uncharacterized protein n=1 Tax=Hypholoma sublateritium (strain FD-334 SS-4) TaxID=945553 RepID=A0A0D2P9R7_HYPSF|nr:hypothetical protein HYPSUDRAFT_219078 [Hypholoma sublateritium FD-334 SS-4]
MFTRFQTSIVSAFRKTLQFLGMENTLPTGPETISEDGTDIEVYLFNLVTGYDSSGASLMDQCTVRELHLCKEQTSVGHEYISVQVLRDGSNIPFYIHFERFRGAPAPDQTPPSAENIPAENCVEGRQSLSRLSALMQVSSDGVSRAVKASNEAVADSEHLSKDISPFLKERSAMDKAFMRKTATKSGDDAERCRTVTFSRCAGWYDSSLPPASVYAAQIKSARNVNDFEAEEGTSSANSKSGRRKQVKKKPGRVPLFSKTPLFLMYSLGNVDIAPIVESYKVDLQHFEKKARSRDIEIPHRCNLHHIKMSADSRSVRGRGLGVSRKRTKYYAMSTSVLCAPHATELAQMQCTVELLKYALHA